MPAVSAAKQSEWQRWNAELQMARKVRGYEDWCKRGQKIVKRYRDQRTDEAEYSDTARSADSSRFNILWSNIQTLMPAVFAKQPKPVVERRYLDRDDVGRTASVILERGLLYELDHGTYFEAVKRAVLDRLLPGRGIVWVRYEPTFRNVPAKTQEGVEETDDADLADLGREQPDGDGAPAAGVSAGEGGDLGGEGTEVVEAEPEPEAEPEQEKIYECVPVDYLDWQDFLCSPARTWEENWWVAKRVYLTRDELIERFGDKVGSAIKLDWTSAEAKAVQPATGTDAEQASQKAKIWEIWDKRDRKVRWTTESDPGLDQGDLLETVDDPLKLEGFWPCPKPLSATLTNDTMIPVPDYVEYQDQADELDELTGRISSLTKALKVAGVYDASIPELQRILQEGKENELVAVDNMAEFSQKGGADGMGHVWLLPIKDIATVLMQLYDARDRVKQVLYEITGISDIVRGQASEGGAKTATEQRIKGQFASLRLNDIQADVARFARDVLRIMGEIIAEHYSEETLMLVSAYAQYAKEQFLDMPDAGTGAAPGQPGIGHNGGPPMGAPPGAPVGGPPPMQAAPSPPVASPPGMNGTGAGGPTPVPQPPAGMNGAIPPAAALPMAAPMIAMAPPPPTPAEKAAKMFTDAVALLRNDKLRGFRIDIETDSIIEPDQQATQQGRTELLGAISQFLPQAMQAGAADPKLKPLLGQLLLYFLRGFKAGRDLEGMFEQFIDEMQKEAKNPKPKPPSPEEIKANAEIQKQQMEGQRMKDEAAIRQQEAAQAFQLEQQKAAMKEREQQMELQYRERLLALKEREAQINLQGKVQVAQIDAASAERQGQIDAEAQSRDAQAAEHAAGLDREATDHKHEVGLEMMDAKAKNAAKAAKGDGVRK